MYRMNTIIFYSIILLLSSALPLQAGWFPWDPSTLVTINGEEYTTEDFKVWWENWQEKDMKLPESPSLFVDWILLFKEAEKMRLYESPVYRKKVITFLRARTLMQLKGEEIDSKIKITDDDLWNQYQKTHSIRYQLNIFFFKNQETAQKFVDKLGNERVSGEEFATKHGRGDAYYSQRTEWYRPLAINPGWIPIIHELDKGEMSPPVSWKEEFVVLRLQDKLEESREDFDNVKKSLERAVWKTKENQLTIELVTRLREKYQVKVNTERLKQLIADATEVAISDIPLISTNNGDISEKIVLDKIRQVESFRNRNGFKTDANFQFKNQVVNGIIDQTLTSWEGLARKYEQKPPLKAVYEFYCQHRMIKLLEEKVFFSKAAVSQEEIESYYQENIALFTQPEVIRIARVQGAAEALKALWLEVALGKDFVQLAQKSTGQEVPLQDVPINHLDPKIKEVVDNLTVGEVSQVFTVDGQENLVQLIKRQGSQITPLLDVKEDVRKTLHTAKVEALRQEYLAKLQVEFPVEINDTVWQNLKKELEQLDETN